MRPDPTCERREGTGGTGGTGDQGQGTNPEFDKLLALAIFSLCRARSALNTREPFTTSWLAATGATKSSPRLTELTRNSFSELSGKAAREPVFGSVLTGPAWMPAGNLTNACSSRRIFFTRTMEQTTVKFVIPRTVTLLCVVAVLLLTQYSSAQEHFYPSLGGPNIFNPEFRFEGDLGILIIQNHLSNEVLSNFFFRTVSGEHWIVFTSGGFQDRNYYIHVYRITSSKDGKISGEFSFSKISQEV